MPKRSSAGGESGCAFQVIEIRAARALEIAAALAEHADVEQRGVELRIERARAVQPCLRIGGTAEAIEGDAVVIRGFRAQRRRFIRENLFEIGRRFRGIAEAQQRDGAIEASLGERRHQFQRRVEGRQRLGVLAFHQERESAEILDLGRRRAGRFRAFELMQRGVVLPAEEVEDTAIAGGLRGEKKDAEDHAAPRTCSSIWMSPRFTAFTNASTTRGSKRVPAKLLIFSTT